MMVRGHRTLLCERLLTRCKHVLVDVLVRTNTIDCQKEKGNREEETEDNANILKIERY